MAAHLRGFVVPVAIVCLAAGSSVLPTAAYSQTAVGADVYRAEAGDGHAPRDLTVGVNVGNTGVGGSVDNNTNRTRAAAGVRRNDQVTGAVATVSSR